MIFSSTGFILRRVDYGDYDLILTFFSRDQGKISAIAKSAKKSAKRFAGVLELFSQVRMVCRRPRRGNLPVLQEAAVLNPFAEIRSSVRKTVYASYWSELVTSWFEENQPQTEIYQLLDYSLGGLNTGEISEGVLSVLFQMRFLSLSGHRPNLSHCSRCGRDLDDFAESRVVFDLPRGGLICDRCTTGSNGKIRLQRGTLKQLRWLANTALSKVGRMRVSPEALQESFELLDAFLPYHLGKEPKSLKFLRQLRKDG